MKKEENLPMNILICGTKIEYNYIKSLFEDNHKKSEKQMDNYIEYTYSYGWKFDFFKEGLDNDNLEQVSKKMKKDFIELNFKDLIICFTQKQFENIKNVIKYFSKMNEMYHTFIIFITDNPNIKNKDLYDFINDELETQFDPRNVDTIHFNSNDVFPLFELLFYKSCYFNEMGRELILPKISQKENISKKKKINHCFNILVIGKPGSGKSTLINILSGYGKISKEATGGGKITTKICQYNMKNTNIIFYDTPGFGAGNELQTVYQFVLDEIKKMKEEYKEKFFSVFYLLDHNLERHYEDKEKGLLIYLFEQKIPFYFILNKSQKPKENTKRKKKFKDNKKEILEESLINDFPEYKKYIKVISLNLKINANDDCFGLEEVFQNLYDYYKDFKINLEILKNNKKKAPIILKNSPFFEGLLSKNDILESIRARCMKEIAACSLAAAGVGFIPISFADWPILVGIQISMIISIAAQFGIEIDSLKAKDIMVALTKTSITGGIIGGAGKIVGSLVKWIPGVGNVVGGTICASTAGISTYSMGRATIEYFTPDLDEFEFFYQRSKAFNESIDKLLELAELIKKKEDYIFLYDE